MIAPLNCDECKMQYRCTHISADCKYPEGRLHGVTTYDKMIADKGSALEKRLEEAEKVIDAIIAHSNHYDSIGLQPQHLETIYEKIAKSYRAKYPKGGE
jgi:hypothetical protein